MKSYFYSVIIIDPKLPGGSIGSEAGIWNADEKDKIKILEAIGDSIKKKYPDKSTIIVAFNKI